MAWVLASLGLLAGVGLVVGVILSGTDRAPAPTRSAENAWLVVRQRMTGHEHDIVPEVTVTRLPDSQRVLSWQGPGRTDKALEPGQYRATSDQMPGDGGCSARLELRGHRWVKVTVTVTAGEGCQMQVSTGDLGWSGLAGTVTLVEGNCQPGSVGEQSGCTTGPVSRQIFIFSPPLPAGGFQDTYYVGQQGPAGAVRSDTDGHYRVDLPPGTYSLLVEDQGKRYCGRFFEQVACVVTIDSAGHLAHDVLIEHAVF